MCELYYLNREHHMDFCEKILAALFSVFFFTYLSHLRVLDQQTNFDIGQRDPQKIQNAVFNGDFVF